MKTHDYNLGVRCTGCGSSWTDEQLAEERQKNPNLLSCCPERKMLPAYFVVPAASYEAGAAALWDLDDAMVRSAFGSERQPFPFASVPEPALQERYRRMAKSCLDAALASPQQQDQVPGLSPEFVDGWRKLNGLTPPQMQAPGHITEYDPNITWGEKAFSMTFMQWAFSATHTATVGGNCRAMDNLGSALSHVYDGLPVDQYGTPYMILTDANGETLQVIDERGRSDDWLMDMLVATHLVSIKPEGRW